MKKVILFIICLFLSLTVRSQSWRAIADSLVVNQLFINNCSYADLYSFPELLTNTDTVFTDGNDTINVPYSNCIGYFVNLMPFANWSHPCKFCFVNSSGNYTIIDSESPPICDSLITLSLCPRTNLIASTTPAFDTLVDRTLQHSDPEHLWAVLICGNDAATATRPITPMAYWFDLSCVYTVLANVFGYQENTDESYQNRHIIVTAPQSVRNQSVIPDLNGNDTYLNNYDPYLMNQGGDFFYCGDAFTMHTKNNIKNIFDCFAGRCQNQQSYEYLGLRRLTEEDQLFIFITGHGQYGNVESNYFFINEDDRTMPKIYDTEFVSWLQGIECSQMTLFMENCYSGSFIDKFLNDINEDGCLCKNRIGFSATSAQQPSHTECYQVYSYQQNPYNVYHYVSEFVYYWASSALGYYPYLKGNVFDHIIEIGPWNHPVIGRDIGSMNWTPYFNPNDSYEISNPHLLYDVNPDTDQDGILSISEMFEFANNLDTWSPHGYYRPYGEDPLDNIEYPKLGYESSFTQEAATLVGYEGQIDGVINSGIATQPYRLCGDLWISPDSELTMRDVVQSPEDVKIFIKPSGKLILDGATLTNLPEQQSAMWKGVQVWGNANKHQIIENGHYWQGVLEMINGASIRNAVTGIDVWNPEEEGTSGGIVKAINSHFINNTTAVFFHPYENQFEDFHHPGAIIVKDNVSYFKSCDFSIDEQYIGPDVFEMHANLFRVRGVGFYDCHFSFVNNSYSTSWPMGIHAWDAGFKLGGVCTSGNQGSPCQVFANSTFDGFYKAVVSVNDGAVGVRSVTIKNTDFENNSFGVFALRSGFVTVLNSNFSIGRDNTPCAAGIFTDQTPNFTIEQNTFSIANQHPEDNFGIVIKDSRSQNLIYKNQFTGLYCANLSVGRNNTWMLPRNEDNVKADIIGLEYRCNENSNNWCDFYVLGGDNYYKEGIQTNQGSTYSPANNTFSQINQFQFINHGNYGINYYYNAEQMFGSPNSNSLSSYGITLVETKDTIGCLSHYSYGGVGYNDTLTPVLSPSQRLQRESDYYEAYTAYNSIRLVYDDMINGGNSEGEIDDIRTATPSDMWSLRAQLLGHSPYLTNEVLISMLERNDVFPQSVLFEILASNPDELKRDTLINHLQNMDNPLPDYMIGLLRQIADGITVRTAMEAMLAKYSQEYRQAAGDMIRDIICDTVIDKTALIGWLGNMNDLESDREIVSIYIEDGNYSEAFALANLLPTLYGLSGDDLVEYDDYLTLLNLYRILNTDGRNTMQLDSTETATVEYIADNGTGVPQAMAKSIMTGAYGYHYYDCPSGLDFDIPIRGIGGYESPLLNEDLNRALGFSVDVSPNPASTWVAVDYKLPVGATVAQMRIVDALGVTVATYDLQGKMTQKVLDLRELSSGVYTYTVCCGKNLQSGKIIIVK